ncbi:MAG: hypothetical protein EON88_28670 [Brevundimonas sp.]|nr:MAG: hypothetical protein EON88_28670 [Brevundimonas sp.]
MTKSTLIRIGLVAIAAATLAACGGGGNGNGNGGSNPGSGTGNGGATNPLAAAAQAISSGFAGVFAMDSTSTPVPPSSISFGPPSLTATPVDF